MTRGDGIVGAMIRFLPNPHAAADGHELIGGFDSPEDVAAFAAEHGLSVDGEVETNWPLQTVMAVDVWVSTYGQ